MYFHTVHKSDNPGKSSAVRSVRFRLQLLEKVGEIAKERGQSVNSILVTAVEAGLPAIERGATK